MKEFVTVGYSYNELRESAKERVKQWYLETTDRAEQFHEDIMEYLKEQFPRSDLKVGFSFGYCQGDGLNIHGRLNMYDFLNKWNACDEVKDWMNKILDHTDHWYNFAENNRYCYSCKFIDRKYIDEDVSATVRDLEDTDLNIADSTDLIKQFYTDLVDYFEELDRKFEKDGYTYLYECEEDEIADYCAANDFYFTESGTFLG